MKVVVVDYGAGNWRAVLNALGRLGAEAEFTSDPIAVASAQRVIVPGVGNAATAMHELSARGLLPALLEREKPTLGICLGMQLFGDSSAEGDTKCLGLAPFRCGRFENVPRVPHTGWSRVDCSVGEPIFAGIPADPYFYFVHSYFVPVGPWSVGTAHYGEDFCAAVRVGPYVGVQFHPERSGQIGEQVLVNFLEAK